jgi:hypothetical protein
MIRIDFLCRNGLATTTQLQAFREKLGTLGPGHTIPIPRPARPKKAIAMPTGELRTSALAVPAMPIASSNNPQSMIRA